MAKTMMIGLVTILALLVLVSLCYPSLFETQHLVSLLGKSERGLQSTQMLSSFRSDLAHPYGSMRSSDGKFVNPYNMRQQAVNTEPLHPYNNGKRPKAVLHREFEHNPYGNHLPWETGPAGALAKDIKRPDRSGISIISHNVKCALILTSPIQTPRIQIYCES